MQKNIVACVTAQISCEKIIGAALDLSKKLNCKLHIVTVQKAKEDAKAESKELEETISKLTAETAELEKRLKASDRDTQKFLIYMQSFQDYLNKALSIVNGLEKEQKEKMQSAVKDVLKKILEQIGG